MSHSRSLQQKKKIENDTLGRRVGSGEEQNRTIEALRRKACQGDWHGTCPAIVNIIFSANQYCIR